MVAGLNWREEVNKQFSFLYARGYLLSEASVNNQGAQAIFSSKRREIAIRMDDTNRVYVQIYRSRFLWDLLSTRTEGVNVFELARRHPSRKEIPVMVSNRDLASIFQKNAEFMQEQLSAVIDGSEWVEQ